MDGSATELRIIGKSLDDMIRRLTDAPQTPSIQEASARVRALQRTTTKWQSNAPADAEVSATLERVLEMHVALIRAGLSLDDEDTTTS